MDCIIVGAGSFAEVAKTYFEEYSDVKIKKFAISEKLISSNANATLDLITIEELLLKDPDKFKIFVAVGYSNMNQVRTDIFEHFLKAKFSFLSFIHPQIKVWSNSSVGRNCFIFEDNTLQPFTHIGDNTIIWSGNHIGHHTTIGRNCFISSHVVISGHCTVGDNSFIGVNATLHDSISIGEKTLIGAGAIISRNTDAQSVYVPKSTPIFPKNSFEIGF
jgi:sugar O-acyltransferase (sialic acid O-acetyltransferase NeuD family)